MIDTIDIQTQLQEKWLIIWWAISIGVLAIWIAWHKGFFKSFEVSYLPEISGKDVLSGFALFLFTEVLLIPMLAGFIFATNGKMYLSDQAKGWLNLVMVLGGFASVLLAYSFLTVKQRKELWQQDSETWTHHISVGIAAWFLSFPLVLAFNQIVSIYMWQLFHHPFVEQSVVISLRQARENPLLFGVTSLSVVIIIPFMEEYLFRGLLQSWLKRKLGRALPAVILSSLVFAAFHFTVAQGFTNVELLSSLFLLSCMLGYVFERQRSLWASIGLHSFFNFISLLMIFKD